MMLELNVHKPQELEQNLTKLKDIVIERFVSTKPESDLPSHLEKVVDDVLEEYCYGSPTKTDKN